VKRPRFIAGAVCPACGAMDRLQLTGEGDERTRHCVSCGHEDHLSAAASQAPKSRLDGALKKTADRGEVQSVRILGPDPGTRSAGDTEPPDSVGH